LKLALWFPGVDTPEFVGFSRVRMRLINELKKHGFIVLSGGYTPPDNCIQISWTQPFDTDEYKEAWDKKDDSKVAISIGYTTFESSLLPNGWAENFEQHDAAWTTSNFCVDVLGSALSEKNINKKVYRVRHGVDSSFFPILSRDAFRGTERSTDSFNFLWMGLSPQDRKRGRDVHEAFKIVQSKHPDWNIDLIIKFLPLNNKRGHFWGLNHVSYLCKFMPHNELLAMLYNTDAFIYPSRCEGFGLQPLELTATGIPCAATAYSGMIDYLFDAEAIWKDNESYFLKSFPTLDPFKDFNGALNGLMYAYKRFNISDSFYVEEERRVAQINQDRIEQGLPPMEIPHGITYGEWAAKDAIVPLEDIVQSMEFLYENQYSAKLLANLAAKYIHSHWTWDIAIDDIVECFKDMGIYNDIAKQSAEASFIPDLNFLKVSTGKSIRSKRWPNNLIDEIEGSDIDPNEFMGKSKPQNMEM